MKVKEETREVRQDVKENLAYTSMVTSVNVAQSGKRRDFLLPV